MPPTARDDLIQGASALDPLPSALRHGLMAVSFFGFLSFISSTALFFYLTFKLIKWWHRGQAKEGYNQFVLLLYNLVIADIQQSIAFLLTARWLYEDKIEVDTPTCWAQGWFVSTGDLASGMWILAIAVHTFFAIIKGYQLSNLAFLLVVGVLWLFIYLMAIAGVASKGPDFYTRAGAWCWIDDKYSDERLWLHYLYIFVAMFGTMFVYLVIYAILRSRLRSIGLPSRSDSAAQPTQSTTPGTITRAAQYMIIYPAIYVLCTLPLAAGRMAAMNGLDISHTFYCLAGAAITSCGWLDVLLYACTRRVLVFSSTPPPVNECGLDTFGILNSPETFWGPVTTIEGGVLRQRNGKQLSRNRRSCVSGQSGGGDEACDSDDSGLYASTVEGNITTKTTIEVRTESVDVDPSDIELSLRILGTRRDQQWAAAPQDRQAPTTVRTMSETDGSSWHDTKSGNSVISG